MRSSDMVTFPGYQALDKQPAGTVQGWRVYTTICDSL